MAEVGKKRAPNNRTLSVSAEEISQLRTEMLDLSAEQSLANLSGKLPPENLENRTILGDALLILPHMPSDFADLIVVDPPYNLSKNFNGFSFSPMSDDRYEEYLESFLGELVRILKPAGSLYICGDWKSSSAIQRSISRHLALLNRITWGREKGRSAKSNWKSGMEDIWFAVKNPKEYFFDPKAVSLRRRVIAPYRESGEPKGWEDSEAGKFRDTAPSNFWDDISVPFWSMPENTDHPTQKPEKLVAKLVLASSRPGDLVFDPFLGSGTTSVVAKKLGRKFCGIERDVEYASLAQKRLALAENEKSIQGYADGIFWERNSRGIQKCPKK